MFPWLLIVTDFTDIFEIEKKKKLPGKLKEKT